IMISEPSFLVIVVRANCFGNSQNRTLRASSPSGFSTIAAKSSPLQRTIFSIGSDSLEANPVGPFSQSIASPTRKRNWRPNGDRRQPHRRSHQHSAKKLRSDGLAHGRVRKLIQRTEDTRRNHERTEQSRFHQVLGPVNP